MWEIESYDWSMFEAYRDPSRVPEMLRLVIDADDASEWNSALSYLEKCGADLGVPCSITPALVSCLVSIAFISSGQKLSDVLWLLEEFTCARGEANYTDAQKKWLNESVNELVFGLKRWVELMERSTIEDAELCVDMLAYCAERFPVLRGRVTKYLKMCQMRFPGLEAEISAVSAYFRDPV
jgi:hypothetical protein